MSTCRDAALDALAVSLDADPADLAPLPAPDAESLSQGELFARVVELLAHAEAAHRAWGRLPDTDDPDVLAELAACEDVLDAAEDALRDLGFAALAEAEDWADNLHGAAEEDSAPSPLCAQVEWGERDQEMPF